MWGTHGAGRPRSASGPVHPHACGEHSGPSGEDGRRLRFIPTHVGNTPGGIEQRLTTAVHPHACGEHSCEAAGAQQTHGSSPRMWGTPGWLPPDPPRTRFIPTHVGNTPPRPIETINGPVHPHACGEHCKDTSAPLRSSGSSPRMWGTLDQSIQVLQMRRFIPTHVGNTWRWRGRRQSEAVHPHACGEHWRFSRWRWALVGSSPRMWGTPLLIERATRMVRFIPTHVGNT